MTDLLAVVVRLANSLSAENAALRVMDLPGATALLVEKQAAAAAFDTARRAATPVPTAALRAAVLRLTEEAAENRRLLERAIHVQTRVLGVVAGAARTAGAARRYGRSGAYAGQTPGGWALSARA